MSRDLEAGFQNFFASYVNGQEKSTEKQQSPFLRAILYRAGIYDVIQLTVEKLAERIQGIGGDGFVRLASGGWSNC